MQVAIKLQVLSIGSAIHIPGEVYLAIMHEKVPLNPEFFKPLLARDRIEKFFNELITLGTKMKKA